jgi:hypothetical protein
VHFPSRFLQFAISSLQHCLFVVHDVLWTDTNLVVDSRVLLGFTAGHTLQGVVVANGMGWQFVVGLGWTACFWAPF